MLTLRFISLSSRSSAVSEARRDLSRSLLRCKHFSLEGTPSFRPIYSQVPEFGIPLIFVHPLLRPTKPAMPKAKVARVAALEARSPVSRLLGRVVKWPFFPDFNPILARLQKTLSEHLLGDREGTRALYLQRKFQRQRTSKASTAIARNFSKCNRMCFWNSPHFCSS